MFCKFSENWGGIGAAGLQPLAKSNLKKGADFVDTISDVLRDSTFI
jgi:hypothetical protein